MLTNDLVDVKITGHLLEPKLLSCSSKSHLSKAEQLLTLLRVHEGRTLGEFQEAIQSITALEVKHKLWKGLAKVLLDQCTFEPPVLEGHEDLSAAELRQKVFQHSARLGYATQNPQFGRCTKEEILRDIANDLGSTVENVLAYLYADHKDMHILKTLPDIQTPEAMLQRYNLVLCQSILLHAKKLRIILFNPSAKWLRFIFRRIKFYRLMYRVYQRDNMLEILIDGPQSVLTQSSRYGLQFAMFLPVLPLYNDNWRLEAELAWGKKRKVRKQLILDPSMGLQSHYQVRGLWKSTTEEWFEQRFAEKESDWLLQDGDVLDLGNQQVLIPNFRIQHRESPSRFGYLNIVGFWMKSHVIDLINSSPESVVFAVSKRYAADTKKLPQRIQERIIVFAEVISVKDVLELIENNTKV
jgi:predicted nuclease of restriction endonuclease-like RecB superfamily